MTMGAPGTRCSIASFPHPLAQWLYPLRILRLFTSPVAKVCSAPICRWVMEFINLPTQAKHGLIWVFAMDSKFPRWQSIRTIQTGCLQLYLDILTALTRSAEFSVRPTAE